ncbi:MAG: HTH domain-containing protein [Kofleriaceae bacterium]|nr:HTH domain-containing protein [Kofleriaceae bacterium]MCL4227120.1 HTH domain-containing protein [Myxococcales bacterium]
MRKKSRLFALAEALRGRRTGVTAQELADRFGVTLRTIYRDLAALQDAGLPLRADRGRGGGYALDRAYQLPPVNLSAREGALLVALGKMALDQRLLPFTASLEAALDKVRGALSASAQRELLRLVDQLQIVGVPALPVPPAVRTAVETAWFEDRALTLHYQKVAYHAPVVRAVRIRNLVFDRAVTLLNCVDLELGEDRQFRLDRIRHAELLDAPGAEPAQARR